MYSMQKARFYDIDSPKWSEGRSHTVAHYIALLLTCMIVVPYSWVGSLLLSQGWLCSGMPGPGQSEVGSQCAEWWLGLLHV